MTRLAILAAVAAATLGATAAAESFAAGDITIENPFIFETPPAAKAGGGYMMVTNNGSTDDRLIAVSGPVDNIQLHNVETDDQGVTRMLEQTDGIVIPAGETVMLQPGGLHVMFMGLSEPFTAGGDVIPATLTFENAGEVPIEFTVMVRGQMKDGGHSGHSGHGSSHGN